MAGPPLLSEQDFKNHNDLPLARIKRIMKSDEVRLNKERLERSDSSISHTTTTNNLPFVASLLTAHLRMFA